MATTGNNQTPDTPTAGNTDHPASGGSSTLAAQPVTATAQEEPAAASTQDVRSVRGTPRVASGLGLEDGNTGLPLEHERDHHAYPYDRVPLAPARRASLAPSVTTSRRSGRSESSQILGYLADMRRNGATDQQMAAQMDRLLGVNRELRSPSSNRMEAQAHPMGIQQVIQQEPVFDQALNTLEYPTQREGETVEEYFRRRAAAERQRSTPDPISTDTTLSPSQRQREKIENVELVDDRDNQEPAQEMETTIQPKQEPVSATTALKGKGRAVEPNEPRASNPGAVVEPPVDPVLEAEKKFVNRVALQKWRNSAMRKGSYTNIDDQYIRFDENGEPYEDCLDDYIPNDQNNNILVPSNAVWASEARGSSSQLPTGMAGSISMATAYQTPAKAQAGVPEYKLATVPAGESRTFTTNETRIGPGE
ncbi:hypothetical protein BKA70DRAFT_1219414 [Coprinopsis sp. MPI-PUGE-AT-0042]|nr:hypothetical protein BKA70DRAFT_1219414 [Coprinopsis sp. MPI-PUGE-AT-0042]